MPVEEYRDQGRRHTQYVLYATSLSPLILHLDINIPTFIMVCHDRQRFCVCRHIVEEYHNQNKRHTQAGISEAPGKNGLEGFPGKTGK